MIMMGGTLASRVTGLLRNGLLAQFFSTAVVDAFVTAFKVPNLFRELLAEGALTNSFVPVYKRLSREEGRVLSGALLSLLVILNGVLLLAAYAAAPWIANVLIANVGNVDVELTTRLIRIVFPFLSAISLSALAMGILNAEERFLAPAWAPVALNVITVIGMIIFPGHAVALALAHVFGGVAQLAVQIPALARHGLLPKIGVLWHPSLVNVVLLMIPLTFTASGRQILNVVTSRVITGIDAGAQGAFYLADLFLSLALGLFSISPALSYYSRLSKQASEPHEYRHTLVDGLKFISFLTIPAGFLLFLLAGPAVDALYNWRSVFSGVGMDPAMREMTISVAGPLGLAVFPIGLFNLLIRTFFIRERVKLSTVLVLGFLTLQGIMYVVFAPVYGLPGVAWANVAVAWLQLLVMLRLVHRFEAFAGRELLNYIGKVAYAGILAALIAGALLTLFTTRETYFLQIARLVWGGGLYVLVFGVAAWLLDIPEARALVDRFTKNA